MQKVLVAVTDYPRDTGEKALMFVHVRNKYYMESGIDVTVLNFSAGHIYEIDGIRVITQNIFKTEKKKYDVLILHAANIRQHYFFLKRYEKEFGRFIFFYHGHEILRITRDYPEPYEFKKRSKFRNVMQEQYDTLKFRLWRAYLPKLKGKADYVFVSKWLFYRFYKYVIKDIDALGGKKCIHIIHNGVGKVFEETDYNNNTQKNYDFITIRSNMDDSKYGVDVVCDLAERYPNYRFLVIGRGEFFKYRNCPKNMTWISQFLSHEEMLKFIDESKCALLPTREDTQGVMTCECATYGIPTITSDIEVCREICGDCEHIALIPNEVDKVDLQKVLQELLDRKKVKYKRYFYRNTVRKEEHLIEKNNI